MWVELDSMLVVNAFKKQALVLWMLIRNRWKNCLYIVSTMNFIVSHIFREGNQCADYLANLGLICNVLIVWLQLPIGNKAFFFLKNKLGMPNFRFVYH